jgi:hypothetical protein
MEEDVLERRAADERALRLHAELVDRSAVRSRRPV